MAVLYGKPHYSGARNNEVELYTRQLCMYTALK